MTVKYEVVEIEEKNIRGLEIFVDQEIYQNDGIADLWMELIQRVDLNSMENSYGVSKYFDIEAFEFEYMAGVDEEVTIEHENIRNWTIPGGKYARFSRRGPMTRESIAKFYDESFKIIFATESMDSERGINSFELYDKDYIVLGNNESVHYLMIPVIE